jgi:hypothetical protein
VPVDPADVRKVVLEERGLDPDSFEYKITTRELGA